MSDRLVRHAARSRAGAETVSCARAVSVQSKPVQATGCEALAAASGCPGKVGGAPRIQRRSRNVRPVGMAGDVPHPGRQSRRRPGWGVLPVSDLLATAGKATKVDRSRGSGPPGKITVSVQASGTRKRIVCQDGTRGAPWCCHQEQVDPRLSFPRSCARRSWSRGTGARRRISSRRPDRRYRPPAQGARSRTLHASA